MTNDRRVRVRPLPIGWALIDDSNGDWIYYGACLGHAVEWYAQHFLKVDSPAAVQFDAAGPDTWTDVIADMNLNGVRLQELTTRPPVSVKQTDVALAVRRFGDVRASDFEAPIIEPRHFEPTSHRLDLVNPMWTQEHQG